MTVMVGKDKGDVTFEAKINHAPNADIQSIVRNDGGMLAIVFLGKVTDDGKGDIHFKWTSDCPVTFYDYPTDGKVSSGGLLKVLAGVERKDVSYDDCTFTLWLSDAKDNASGGASRTMSFWISTEHLLPDP